MTTKADSTRKAKELERGRFARVLGPGFVIEVTPSKKRSFAAPTKPKPTAPKAYPPVPIRPTRAQVLSRGRPRPGGGADTSERVHPVITATDEAGPNRQPVQPVLRNDRSGAVLRNL